MARPRRPGIFAWGLGLVSLTSVLLLALLATFVAACLSAQFGYRRIQELSGRDQLDIGQLRRYISFSLGEHFIFHLLAAAGIDTPRRQNPLLIGAIAEILVPFSQNNADASFSRARVLLSEIPPGELSSDAVLHDSLERLRSRSDEHLRLRRELKQALESLADSRTRLANTLRRHALLANDVGEFFSLPSQYDSPSPGRFCVYSGGILADLPCIRGMSDNTPDLIALRTDLESNNGRVNLSGEDQHILFQNKIDSFRSTSRELLNEGQEFEHRAEREQSREQQLQKEIAAISSASRHDCGQLLIYLAKPGLTSFYPFLGALIPH